MQRELRIDLLDVDVFSLMRDKGSPPAGVTVQGPTATSLNCDGAEVQRMFIVMYLALPIATGVLANFIYEYLSKHKAKRIRIDRTEINFDRGEIERVVREKLDIQQ